MESILGSFADLLDSSSEISFAALRLVLYESNSAGRFPFCLSDNAELSCDRTPGFTVDVVEMLGFEMVDVSGFGEGLGGRACCGGGEVLVDVADDGSGLTMFGGVFARSEIVDWVVGGVDGRVA